MKNHRRTPIDENVIVVLQVPQLDAMAMRNEEMIIVVVIEKNDQYRLWTIDVDDAIHRMMIDVIRRNLRNVKLTHFIFISN